MLVGPLALGPRPVEERAQVGPVRRGGRALHLARDLRLEQMRDQGARYRRAQRGQQHKAPGPAPGRSRHRARRRGRGARAAPKLDRGVGGQREPEQLRDQEHAPPLDLHDPFHQPFGVEEAARLNQGRESTVNQINWN